MKNKTKAAGFIAAALLCVSSCGGNKPAAADTSETTPDNAPGAVSAENGSVQSDTDDKLKSNWAGISPDTVVSRLKDTVETDDRDYFNITFGEFFSEYLFYLTAYGITDDLSGESADIAKQYRQQIADYLSLERNTMYIADKEYGINESMLNDEQKKRIAEGAEEARQNRIDSYYSTASAALGDGASEEEIEKECRRLFLADLEYCGLSEASFDKWETSEVIQELVIQELIKDVTVTDEELETFYDQAVEEAKSVYESDPSGFEENASYGAVYIPEGTRAARHIFFAFSDEDVEKINNATGSEQELLMEKAFTDELKSAYEELKAQLDSGADFADLQKKYGDLRESYYYVTPGSETFPDKLKEAFYALEKAGDVTGPVLFNNGVYVFKYVDDPAYSDEDIADTKAQMKEYLLEYAQSQKENDVFAEWMKRYPYDVDTELLRIDSAVAETAAETASGTVQSEE